MSKPYGILALFESPHALHAAAEKVRDAGYQQWDCLTPFPLHGLDDAMGIKRSKVPIFTFIGGCHRILHRDVPRLVYGGLRVSPHRRGQTILQFRLSVSPVAYELTILLAAFGTLGGMFILNRLPMHYHPVMNYENFRYLTDDKFAIVIEAADGLYDAEKTAALFAELGAVEVTTIEEEENV
jgi:hypothetical protein